MPDISMCKGGKCPLKDTCYRFTAKPSEHLQSYFEEPPHEIDQGGDFDKCEYYWKVEDNKSTS